MLQCFKVPEHLESKCVLQGAHLEESQGQCAEGPWVPGRSLIKLSHFSPVYETDWKLEQEVVVLLLGVANSVCA